MTVAKFASLTPDLLARKGEATPSVIVPQTAAEFFVTKTAQLSPLRTQRFGSGPTLAIHDSDKTADVLPQAANAYDPREPRRRVVTLPADDCETMALIVVKRGTPRAEMLRLAREVGGELIVPVDVEKNSDGSVLLSLFDEPESFSYDPAVGLWIGAEESSFKGAENAFDDTTGWSIAIALSENGPRTIEICHNGDYEELRIPN